MDHADIFLTALDNVLAKYQRGEKRFLDEDVLRATLFFECLDLFEQKGVMNPRVEPNVTVVPGTNWKADLILGENEVAVELKFEPRYPRLLGWKGKMPVVIWAEVQSDISRLEDYLKAGSKAAHFVMIDEDGRWTKKPIEGGWLPMKLPGWTSYLAHIRRPMESRPAKSL